MNRREEQSLSNAVMNYLAIKGILHYKTRTSGVIFHRPGGGIGYGKDRYAVTQRGAADILAWHEGEAYAFELKAPKGKVSPEQKSWIERFNEAKGIGMVIRSLDEVMNIFEDPKPVFGKLYTEDSGPLEDLAEARK
jgi:hypothetical protein